MVIIAILLAFAAVSVGIGVYFRRSANTVSDFVLGGRAVGSWITAFAFGTTYFSAVVFVGYAGRFGWTYGFSALWIGIGNALLGSLLAWLVLGRRTRVMTKHLDSATMPAFFGSRYFSGALKIFASLIVFVFLVPYTASVYNGLSRIFSVTFSVPYEYIVIGMALLTAVYVIAGGYKATAYNDFFQGILMLFGICAVIGVSLSAEGGFYSALIKLSEIPNETGPLKGMSGAFASFFGPDPPGLAGVLILTSLGTWGLPQMVHKFYTIRDERAVRHGTVVSAVFALIISGGCYLLGGFGRVFTGNVLPEGGFDEIIPSVIQKLPEALIGIILVLVLSASMSTLSSLVLTSSSALTLDLLAPLLKLKEKSSVVLMRVLIAVFLLISVVVALNKNTLIADLMGYSWGAIAGAFLAPFMYGLFWKGASKAAAWATFTVAAAATVLHLIFKPSFMLAGMSLASPVNFGAALMVFNLLLFPLVSALTKKPPKEDADKIFACFGGKGEL